MATVRLQGADRSFEIQGNETLLEAAIREGVGLPYGCSAGNCGLCRARLIEGELKPVRHHDFVFTQAERLHGDFLMCSNGAQSDLTLEVVLEKDPASIPWQTVQAKVKVAEKLGERLLWLKLRLPRSQRLRFLAGQYATLTLEDGVASDSAIASCPCDERHVDFHIRRLPDDDFSDRAFESLRPGQTVTVEAPGGRFAFDDDSTRPALFVAFDTGFAAVKSMLEHLTARESEQPLHLYRICCGKEDLYMHNLCRSWADALDELSYTPLVIEESFSAWVKDERSGMDKVEAMLRRVVEDHPDLSGMDLYVCAPEPVVERFDALAMEHRLVREQFHAEIIRGNSYTRCLGATT